MLWLTNTNELIALLGLLLLRGTILSLLLVMTFLPGVLLLFDKLIGKTTWHANFFNGAGDEGVLAVAGAAAAGGVGAAAVGAAAAGAAVAAGAVGSIGESAASGLAFAASSATDNVAGNDASNVHDQASSAKE